MSVIRLYQYAGDSKVLNKALANPLEKEVNIRTDIDIYNPVMLFQDFNSAYNYMEWDSRYYYINALRYTANKIWQAQCHIDVLMTYKDDIRKAQGTVTQSQLPNDLKNSDIPLYAYKRHIKYEYTQNPFSETNTIIYAILGGD